MKSEQSRDFTFLLFKYALEIFLFSSEIEKNESSVLN